MVNEGDEVVMFEPGFPMFFDHVKFAKGLMKSVPLQYDQE
jgi:aspartate/methionine/tyrosine aminotransferase